MGCLINANGNKVTEKEYIKYINDIARNFILQDSSLIALPSYLDKTAMFKYNEAVRNWYRNTGQWGGDFKYVKSKYDDALKIFDPNTIGNITETSEAGYYTFKVSEPKYDYYENRYGIKDVISSNNGQQYLDFDFTAWAADKLINISPDTLVNQLLNLSKKQADITVQNLSQNLFNKIANKHGVKIKFVEEKFIDRGNLNILGMYDNGIIKYNKDRITLDTYMHEFSHLWSKVIQKKDIKLYNSIKEKVEAYLNSNSELANMINNRTSNMTYDNKIEEAIAIITGITSLPALIKMSIKNLELNNVSYDKINSIFGDDILKMYNSLSNDIGIKSINNIDINNSSLFDILEAISNDIINGYNIFEYYGTSYDDMIRLGELQGRMYNDADIGNVILNVDDVSMALTDNKYNKMSVMDMANKSDSTEFNNWIDNVANLYFVPNKSNKNGIWSIQGISIDVTTTSDGKISDASKKEIKSLIKDIPTKKIELIKELHKSIVSEELSSKGMGVEEKIQELIKTKFGNIKYSIDTARLIADILGFNNSGIVSIYTLSDFIKKNGNILGEFDRGLFNNVDPLIIQHNDFKGPNDEVIISLFSIDKLYSHITGKKDKNLFHHLTSLSDSELGTKGLKLQQNSSTISNIRLGFLAAHLKDKLPNLRIRSIGTMDMSSSLKFNLIDTNELFHNIGYISEVKELYDAINNDTLKSIITKAHNKEYNNLDLSFEDQLRTYYYNSVFYGHADDALLAKYNRSFFDMTHDQKIDFILNRLRYLLKKDANANINNNEFKLLSKVYYELDTKANFFNLSMTESELMKSHINSLHKFATETYNAPNDLVQWAINKVQVNEATAKTQFRNIQEKFQELLKPVWNKRAGLLGNISINDIGSKALEHMFVKYKTKEGKTINLPYIWHNESLFFKHKMFKGKTKEQIMNELNLTKEDLKLGDFVINAIEDSLIDAEIINIENNAFTGKEKLRIKSLKENNINGLRNEALDSLKRRGWNRNIGQMFVTSKSSNELTFSGKIKDAKELVIKQSIDINAIFENRVISGDTDTFRNTLLRQLNNTELLSMAGIVQTGTDLNNPEYELSDNTGTLNEVMSTNIENIFNYVTLANIRQKLHSKDSELTYKAAIAYLTDLQSLASKQVGASLEYSKGYLDEFYTAIVKNQRMPDRFTFDITTGKKDIHGANIKVDVGNIVDILGRGASFMFLAYSPKIALKSAFFNFSKLALFGLGNTFSNNRLPNISDFAKAHVEYFKNPSRAMAWGKHYQVANASMYEIVNSYAQNVTKKFVLNQQLGHAMNQYTDEIFRHITMIAFMINDGSWDAHGFNSKATGLSQLVYDETKDKRLYKDGKITEAGKVIKDAIKKDLIKQELMTEDDNLLKYGYDMQDAISMKAIADKWIMGAYSSEMGANANYHIAGRQLSKFRRFFFSVMGNMFLAHDVKSRIINLRTIEQDENGNYISKREAVEMAATLQSIFKGLKLLLNLKHKSKYAKMTKMEMASIYRFFSFFGMLGLYFLMFGKFRDDDEKREYFIDLYTIFKDTMVFNQISDVADTPLPTISSWYRLTRKGINNPLSLLFYVPGGRAANDLARYIEFESVEFEEKLENKRKAARTRIENEQLNK